MMKLSLTDLTALKHQRQKITMITAYDAPSARFADAAGIDAILVGDSAAMTVFGYDQTTAITIEDMLLLARAARRGTTRALLLADMPFGSVQVSDAETVSNRRSSSSGMAYVWRASGKRPDCTSAMYASIAFTISWPRSAYCFTNFGT